MYALLYVTKHYSVLQRIIMHSYILLCIATCTAHRTRISPWTNAKCDPSDEFHIGAAIGSTCGTGLRIGDEEPKWPALLFRKRLPAKTIQHHPRFDHHRQRHTGAEAAVDGLHRDVCCLRMGLRRIQQRRQAHTAARAPGRHGGDIRDLSWEARERFEIESPWLLHLSTYLQCLDHFAISSHAGSRAAIASSCRVRLGSPLRTAGPRPASTVCRASSI